MVSGKISVNKVNWDRWPCGCCGKGVGSNSILCNKCKKLCHKRCSRLKNVILNKNLYVLNVTLINFIILMTLKAASISKMVRG